MKLSDFTGKEDFDKYRELLDQLLAQNFIVPVQEEEILICLNPGYDTQKSRLAVYKNTNTNTEAIDWEAFSRLVLVFVEEIVIICRVVAPDFFYTLVRLTVIFQFL